MVVQHAIALLAIPAFMPAFALVGAIVWIARKDRRDEERERETGIEDAGPVDDG